MKCPICKHGETRSGAVSVTLERNGATVVFKDVPAQVCDTCGEENVDEKTAARTLELFDEAIEKGVVVDVRRYIEAA